jgi:dTDP-glucose 4,6-dehydratase
MANNIKSVLMTGGCGFIGSHVVEAILKTTDWNIILLDRFDATSTPHRIASLLEHHDPWRSRIEVVYWDLKSPINSFTAQKIGVPNYVLHLAASTHVDRSIADPMMFVMDNVVGTLNLLEWANNVQQQNTGTNRTIEKINYFSTDEVMGSASEGVNYKETDMARPENPYAAAKLGGEALAQAFACTYSMPIFITRTMNVFGERQHPEKFIPMSIDKIRHQQNNILHANKELTKTGTRFYIHARNVANALLFLLQSNDTELLTKQDRTKGIYNIVGEKEISNLELVQMLADYVHQWQQKNNIPQTALIYELVDFHSSRPGHDLRYALDGSKLKTLGFNYSHTLEQSMQKMVEWYLDHPQWLQSK